MGNDIEYKLYIKPFKRITALNYLLNLYCLHYINLMLKDRQVQMCLALDERITL